MGKVPVFLMSEAKASILAAFASLFLQEGLSALGKMLNLVVVSSTFIVIKYHNH